MTKPLISIIIPTYNRAEFVINAIHSALTQTYPNKEIIIVDDGSTDETSTIVQKQFGDQVIYQFQTNQRQAAARNRGLSIAQGEYIATLDSDDVWYPDFLTRSMEFFMNSSIGFCFCNWWQEGDNGERYAYLQTHKDIKRIIGNLQHTNAIFEINHAQLREIFVQGCPSPSSSLLIRKSLLVDGWNPTMIIGDDWEMLLGIILRNNITATFTLDVLWEKQKKNDNIYDGVEKCTVVEQLFIRDSVTVMNKYSSLLTKEELTIMARKVRGGIFILLKDAAKTFRLRKFRRILRLWIWTHNKY